MIERDEREWDFEQEEPTTWAFPELKRYWRDGDTRIIRTGAVEAINARDIVARMKNINLDFHYRAIPKYGQMEIVLHGGTTALIAFKMLFDARRRDPDHLDKVMRALD